MSFFTALTGLNAATAQLGVTANNIANAGTIGFKRSRTDFGDIFATSPLQKASSTVGQGVSLNALSWVGYNAAGETDASVLASLSMLYAVVPSVLLCLAMVITLRYRLTAKRHDSIRLHLENRKA